MYKPLFLLSIFLLYGATASAQWQPQTSEGLNPNHVILSIAAVDENVVWAVVDTNYFDGPANFTPKFLRTTDGGRTWKTGTVAGVVDFFIFDITALDSSTAWVTTNNLDGSDPGGGIYKTTDGGASWTRQREGQRVYIHFFDAQNGVEFFVDDVNTTTDGGTTWTRVASDNVPPGLAGEVSVFFSANNAHAQLGDTIWVGTSKGRVYRSTNRGHNWTVSQTTLGQNRIINSLAFQDGNNGLAVSALDANGNVVANRAATTNDGGVTWTTIDAPATPTAASITYVPGTAGTYVLVSPTGFGEIPGSAYTNDRGTTWTVIDNTHYNGVAFVARDVGWAGGITTSTHGGMFKWSGGAALFSSPRVAHTPIATAESDGEVTIEANISDDDLAEVNLLFRRGGESTFATLPMSDQGNDRFRGAIPAGDVTSRGTEYQILARDMAGNITLLPSQGSISIQIHVSNGISRAQAQPHGSNQTAYHIFSVPLDLDDKRPPAIFEDDLGEYDDSRWRFLEYSPDEQAYLELPDINEIEPGKGYWFLVSEPARIIDTPAGTSFSTADPFGVTVRPGWNLIGNPFNFAIPVSNVTQGLSVVELRTYNGSWNNPISDPVTEIRPFEGYAVSIDDFAAEIFIDPNVPVVGLAKRAHPSTSLTRTQSFLRRQESPPSSATNQGIPAQGRNDMRQNILWSINVQAQCQQARDVDNVLGVSRQASESWDRLDYPEPPPIGEYVSVYFAHPEWGKRSQRFCTDFRPAIGATVPAERSLRGASATKQSPGHAHRTRGLLRPEKHRTRNDGNLLGQSHIASSGHIWAFEVKTNIRDRVELTFAGIESVPQEFDVWLVDESLALTQNLRRNPHYSVAGVGEDHPKRLKLLVGRSDFVDELLPQQEIPTDFELSQNFPNPFNPVTSIRYGLPSDERVTLRIFNILGEEVATLLDDEPQAAGLYVANWDGRDQQGRGVSSGVYLYQIIIGNSRITKKMVLVR